ncbi:MAG: hypothetical protein AAF092_05005 [Pseudomonadota bacterium]
MRDWIDQIICNLRGALMQWLLFAALRVSPPGGARGDLAATIKFFLQRECERVALKKVPLSRRAQ